MSDQQPNITIPVDLTNPGQFFACCGLLELADRLCSSAEGWFENSEFHLRCEADLRKLLACLILDPPVQRRAYGNQGINRVENPWRARSVHYVSILVASLLPMFLLADVMPLVPPLGYLVFLCWRVMRPGLMPLWVGVPLGAFDDLFSGQPFGSAILL